MRIADVQIDRFGICSGQRIEQLAPKINVFYGPNEAGKTTLLQFLRSVLYGFSAERRQRYLPGIAGGGRLVVKEGGHSYTLVRSVDADGFETELQVLTSEGNPAEAPHLMRLVREVGEPVFNAAFAIGLRDFQELGTLSDTSAGDFLFRVAAGINGASLFDVMEELETARNRLLAVDDRPCAIVHLLGRQERLRTEIQELAGRLDQYSGAINEQGELDAEVDQLRRKQRESQEQLGCLQTARRIVEPWLRRRELDEQLQAAGPVPLLPEKALERLEELNARANHCRTRLAKYRPKRHQLHARARAISLNEALWRDAPKAEAFCDQREWITALEGQLDLVADQLTNLQNQLSAARGNSTWAAGNTPVKVDSKAFERLKATARQYQAGRKSVKQRETKLQGTQQAIAALQEQLAKALAGRSDQLSTALEEAGGRASQLRRRLQLDEQAQRLADKRKDLDSERADRLEQQMLPAWSVTAMAIVFALGMTIFIAGLLLPLGGSHKLGLFVACLGLAGAIGVVAAKFMLERRNQDQLELCERQLGMAAAQSQQNQEERQRLDQELPGGGGPLTVQLQAAEKELARLEELIPLETKRQTLEAEAAACQKSLDQQRRDLLSHRSAWRKLVVSLGLPEGFRPAGLKELSQSTQQLDDLQRRIDGCRQERDARAAALSQIAERLRPLLATAGIEPQNKRLSQLLAELRTELAKTAQLAASRDQCRRRCAVLRKREQRLLRILHQVRVRRRQLLEEAMVKRSSELSKLAEQKRLIDALSRERDAAQATIVRELGESVSEEQIAPWIAQVTDPERGVARLNEIEEQIAELDGRIGRLMEHRGELTERVKGLVADRRLAHKQLELNVVTEQLRRSMKRWQALAIGWSILDKLRHQYEQDRQPETLRIASGYFEQLTSGKYCKVWTPLDERVLRVEDDQQQQLPVELLSRGTREQLFLALRLALVKGYSKRNLHLPLVLDDLLVNFDFQRARAAVRVLRDFAEDGHQILVFTCHEHIARLFHRLHIPVRTLSGKLLAESWLDESPIGAVAPSRQFSVPPAVVPPAPLIVDIPKSAVAAKPIEPDRIVDAPMAQERAVRPARKRERLPAAAPPFTRPRPRNDWDAEEFAGEFAERNVTTDDRRAAHSDNADTEAA